MKKHSLGGVAVTIQRGRGERESKSSDCRPIQLHALFDKGSGKGDLCRKVDRLLLRQKQSFATTRYPS